MENKDTSRKSIIDLPEIPLEKILKQLSTKDIGNLEQVCKYLRFWVRDEKILRFKNACVKFLMSEDRNFGEAFLNDSPDPKYSLEYLFLKDKTIFNSREKVHNGPLPIKPEILLLESVTGSPPGTTVFVPKSVLRIKATFPISHNVFFEEGSHIQKIDGDTFCEKEINEKFVPQTMEEIVFPPSLKHIGRDLFWHSHSIKKVVFTGSGVDTIPQSVFAYCYNLEEVILPEKLRFIKNFAFDMCLGLREIRLPETVVSVEKNVFNNCRNLTIYMSRLNNLHLSSFYTWNNEYFSNALKFVFY